MARVKSNYILDQWRASDPELDKLSDEQLTTALHKVYGADQSLGTFATTVIGVEGGNKGMWGNRWSAAADNYQAGLQGTLESVYDKVGATEYAGRMRQMREANEAGAAIAGSRAQDQGAVSSYKDVDGIGGFANYAGGLAVDSLPYMGEMAVGGVVGRGLMSGTRAALGTARATGDVAGATRAARNLNVGSTASGVTASYPSAVGDILQNQREENGTTDLLSSSIGGVGYAGLNALGVGGMASRATLGRNVIGALDNINGVKGMATRGAVKGLGVGLQEGVSETGQEFINQAGRMQVNPEQTFWNDESKERFGESFAGGLTLGGLAGAPGGMRRSKGYQAPNSLIPGTNESQPGDGGLGAAINGGYTPVQDGPYTPYQDGAAYTPYAPQQQQQQQAPQQQQQAPQSPQNNMVLPPSVVTERTGVDPAKPPKPAKPQPPAPPSNEERAAVFQQYGEPETLSTGDASWLGKIYADPAKLEADVNKAAEEDRAKPALVKQAEAAYRAAYKYMHANNPDKKPLTPNQVKGFISMLGISSATDVQHAADKIDTHLAIEKKKKAKNLSPRGEMLIKLREELTGEVVDDAAPAATVAAAPAPTVTPTQAVADQNAAGLGPTPERFRAMKPAEQFDTFLEMAFGNASQAIRAVVVDRMSQEEAAKIPGKSGKAVSRQRVQQLINKEGVISQAAAKKVGEVAAKLGLTEAEVAEWLKPTQPASLMDVATGVLAGPEAAVADEAVLESDEKVEAQSVDEAELNDNEDAGTKQSMGRINSIGGSQSNTDDKETAATVKAVESGKADAIAKEVEKAKKELAQAAAERDPDAKPKVQRVKKDGTVVKATAKESSAVSKKETVGDKIKMEVKAKAAAAKPESVVEEKQADEVVEKSQPAALVKQQTAYDYAAAKWNETDFDGKPTWDELNDKAQEAWIDAVAENRTKLFDMHRVVDLNQPDALRAMNAEEQQTAVDRRGEVERELTEDDLGTAMDVVLGRIEKAGLLAAVKRRLKHIKLTTNLDDDTDGLYLDRVVLLNQKTIRTVRRLVSVLAHELGHAFDEDLSTNPLWRIKSTADGVEGEGLVSRELTNAYARDAHIKKMYKYPLGDPFTDTTYNKDGSVKKLGTKLRPAHQNKREMFAQHFRYFVLDPVGFQLDFPVAHDYFVGLIKNEDAQAAQAKLQSGNGTNQQSQEAQEGRDSGGRNSGPRDPANTGDDRASGADRGSEAQRRFDELINASPPAAQKLMHGVRDLLTPTKNKLAYGLMFGHDFADYVKDKLPAVKDFMVLMDQKGAFKHRLEVSIQEIMQQHFALPKDVQAQVNAFLRGAAKSGKWGYQPGGDTVAIDEGQKNAFEALPASAQDVVKRVFEQGRKTLQQRLTLLNREIIANITDPVEQKKLLDSAGVTLAEMKGPYSPLKRFGDHAIIVKSQALVAAEKAKATAQIEKMKEDPNHYHVEFRHGNVAAQNRRRELQAQFPQHRVEAFEKEEHFKQTDEFQWSILQRLKDNAMSNPMLDGQSDDVKKAIAHSVTSMYIHALTEASARKTELRRRGIAGAELDMMAAFQSQGKADAHFLSSLANNSEINAAIQRAREEADAEGDDKAERKQMLNALLQRHASSFEQQHGGLQDTLMQLTSVWMLLTSPAYYMQNMTQPYMMTLPVLMGRFGFQATSAMKTAMIEVGKTISKAGIELNKIGKTPAEIDMLYKLLNANLIDIDIEQDFGNPDSGKLGSAFESGMKKLARATREVEKLNRIGSALAAYRLAYADARQNGKDDKGAHDQATKYATDTVRQTHGDYSAYNAPLFFQGKWKRMFLQFRKFQVIQASLFIRTLHQSFGDATPEEKAVARKQLGWLMATHGTFAGALGMPAMKIGAGALAYIFGEEDDDGEEYLEKLIGDKDMARLLLRGLPAAAGVDVSGKIGAGNMLSITPFVNTSVLADGRKAYKDYLLALMGPAVGGLLPTTFDGISTIYAGDYYKGLELMLPKGFKDAMRGFRVASEGDTDRSNTAHLSADEISFADGVFQALGLPTTNLTEHRTRHFRNKGHEEHLKDQGTRTKNDFIKAFKAGDSGDMAAARADWADLQESRVRYGMKRQPLGDLLKAPAAQRKRELGFDKKRRQEQEDDE